MPNLRIPLVTNEYYHVFNRGVARNPIFFTKPDYDRAMLALSYYQFRNIPMKLSRLKKLSVIDKQQLLLSLKGTSQHVTIISFVLMPNHFHFLLKQESENGITTFISQFTNSYTRYFNVKHKRVGPLLQGLFKAVHVETSEQLVHLSRYIHLNPITSFLIKDSELFTYPWSSLPLYFSEQQSFINRQIILDNFSSLEDYKIFLTDQIAYSQKLHQIKHLALE